MAARFGGRFDPLSLSGAVAGFSARDAAVYQDAAGFTPAGLGDPTRLLTFPGEPVLYHTAAFVDPADWSLQNEWTLTGTSATIANATANSTLAPLGSLENAAGLYEIRIDVASLSGGNLTVRLGSETETVYTISQPGLSVVRVHYGGAGSTRVNVFADGGVSAEITALDTYQVSGGHFAAPNAAASPVLQAEDGRTFLRTDGQDDILEARVSVGAARSIYVAGRLKSNRAFIVGADFPQSIRYHDLNKRLDSEPGFWQPFDNNTLALDEWFVAAFRMDGATKYLDQITDTGGLLSASDAYTSSAVTSKKISLGARYSNTEHTAVDYASLLIVDGFVSGAEHDRVMSYMAAQAGVSQ